MANAIFLSAGHSTTDPGAITRQVVDGKTIVRREADIAVETRNIVSFYLTQMKVKHTVDGTGTQNVPLAAAIKTARAHAYPIEFHCNSSDDPAATGVETLQDAADKILGARLCAAIADALKIKNRGAKPQNSGHHSRLGFIASGGGIIVELFFISSPKDLAAYDARKWLMAKAIAEVLAKQVI